MVTTEDLLVGERRTRSIAFLGAYASIVAGTLLATLAAELLAPGLAEPLREELVPVVLVYAPMPVAAVGGFLRCGAPASIAVGLIPGIGYSVAVVLAAVLGLSVDSGPMPLWGLSAGLLFTGVIWAFAGFCIGVATAMGVDSFDGDPDEE